MKLTTTPRMLGLVVFGVVAAVVFVSSRNAGSDKTRSQRDQRGSLQMPAAARDSLRETPSHAFIDNSPRVQRGKESFAATPSVPSTFGGAEPVANRETSATAPSVAPSEPQSMKVDPPVEPQDNPSEVEVPLHWVLTGDSASQLQLITDRKVVWNGSASAKVMPRPDAYNLSWGATVQASVVGPHRGKRVEFSAHVRTKELWGGASPWLRADDAKGVVVAFDNATSRMMRGDSSWARMSIVIDIPDDAAYLYYGLLLMGTGTAWMDQAAIEIVTKDVPVTAPPYARRPPEPYRAPQRQAPENMDFEQTLHIDRTLVQ